MKTKPLIITIFVAAAFGLGLLLAQEDNKPPVTAEAALAELADQNKQIIDNQKKIMERLDKLEEDVQFIKNKSAKF